MNDPIAFEKISFYHDAFSLRQAAMQLLEDQIAAAQSKDGTVALSLFDLDNFRPIVQARRIDLAQSILAACLQTLQAGVTHGAAASMGRDEFITLVQDVQIEEALLLTESLRTQLTTIIREILQREGFLDLEQGHPGCSAGVAIFPSHAAEVPILLGKAEEALYRAKRAGRNQIMLPPQEKMVLKSNYYSNIQLERLTRLAARTQRTEASLLREALDQLLRNHNA
jgi:diguanylate cyclase (GGDEF)-like protein